MKKLALVIAIALAYSIAYGQSGTTRTFTNSQGQTVVEKAPIYFGVSKPLWEIAQGQESNVEDPGEYERYLIPNKRKQGTVTNQNALPFGDDPIWQKDMGGMTGRAPIINFDGLMENGGVPVDPSGAAGPNHYVQAINTQLRVYDKTGSPLSTINNLSVLWTGSSDDGDPIVLYDKHADRWFISQFQVNTPTKLLVAVSTSNDPLGTYYTYAFDFGSNLPDYPKYSIWWDGYYFSINSAAGTSGAVDRTKMLAGDPTATLQILTAPGVLSNGFTSMLPADADGALPPNGSPCYFFNVGDDGFGAVQDGIQVYRMSTDWNTPGNTSITLDGFVNTSAFDTDFSNNGGGPPGNVEHISQPGTSMELDAVNGVFYYRAQHRVWAGYNSVVLCHVVDVNGNDLAGMRWYELRNSGSGWTLYQEGTYAPADNINRWMGSVSMDDQGDIGMIYSVSNSSTFPGIRYTGRLSTDPLGTFTVAEQTVVDGATSQTSADRYGDYSQLGLDPNGSTFWGTSLYMASDGYQHTRIFSFEIGGAIGVENPFYANLETQVYTSYDQIQLNVTGLYNDDELTLDIFDLNGKLLRSQEVYPMDGSFSESLPTYDLSSGMYMVRFGNINFQVVEKVNLIK